jgi:all-trans-retinol 13,14-reductase
VLAGTNALYAGAANKTPLYVHALVVNSYIQSAWKCIDGGAQIGNFLAKSIKEMAGSIRNYAEVKKLNFSGDSITNAELLSGEKIEGKNFISNAHPSNTLQLIEEGKLRKSYVHRIESLENSISVFIVHIVFKENSFPYLNHNYYHHKSENSWSSIDYKEENWPESYAVFTPASSKSETYADNMSVMAYMKFEEVKQWENTFHTIPKHSDDRGSQYLDFKEKKAELLLTELEKKFSGIRSKIKSYTTSTPLSYRDYIGSNDGSMYGIAKDHNDPLRTFISAKTKIPNLYLTGQNLNMHGVLGVTIGSVVTCSEITGMDYLVKKITES